MKLALAGDAMLGRRVGEVLGTRRAADIVGEEVRAAIAEADQFVLNLESPISDRGEAQGDPATEFLFRAPPAALDFLLELGVGGVSLGNNHALDYGPDALLDTFARLDDAGIAWVGAGPDLAAARRPVVFDVGGFRLALVAVCGDPPHYAATPDRPGVAYARLDGGEIPAWLAEVVAASTYQADAVMVTPHWGPSAAMTEEPIRARRMSAAAIVRAGASFVAGHSAHLVQGVEGLVLYDMGDFLNDYAHHITKRNDLGLLFLLTLDRDGPVELEAVPLHITFRSTALATGQDAAWIRRRFRRACRALGTDAHERNGRVVVSWL